MKLGILFIVDFFVVFCSVLVSFKLSPSFTKEILVSGKIDGSVLQIAFGASFAISLVLYIINSGDLYLKVGRIEAAIRTMIGCMLGMVVFTALYGLIYNELFGRYVFALSVAISWVATYGVRTIRDWLPAAQPERRVFFIGSKDEFELLNEIVTSSTRGLSVEVLIIADNRSRAELEALLARAQNETGKVGDVVVGRSVTNAESGVEFLMTATMQGANLIEISAFCEKNLRCVFNKSINVQWFWPYNSQHFYPMFLIAKRVLDIAVSIVGLSLSLPFGALVAVFLKLQDGGPVFYSQVREGYMGRPFRIFKFRSMRVDAEKDGARWAVSNDKRVTKLGRFLRTTRLDELPQFWNILRGDMSFVGPRPERPEMVSEIQKSLPFFRFRNLVKPGLTGWAQINYPYAASIEDSDRKLAYDLYYIKNLSLFLDMVIMFRTLSAMIKGAR